MSKNRKVVVGAVLGVFLCCVAAVVDQVNKGVQRAENRHTQPRKVDESPYKILKAETGPRPSREAVEEVLASEAKRSEKIMDRQAEQRARERLAEMEYWWDPARHFSVHSLRVLGSTKVQGLGKVTGRATNIGSRDAEYLRLTFRLLDAQGRRVGRATAVNHDGLAAGRSWDFDAVMSAHIGGTVEVRLDPNGVEAH